MERILANGWLAPRRPHVNSQAAIEENRDIVSRVQTNLNLQPHSEPNWNQNQVIPGYSDTVPISELFDHLMLLKNADEADSFRHTASIFLLKRLLGTDPNSTCRLYCFNPKKRSENASGNIEIFQGRNQRTNYPGDRNLRADNRITVHIHPLNIQTNTNTTLSNIPAVAICIPPELGSRIWFEN